MGSIETSDFRRRRKNNLIQVAGGKCSICGYHKSNFALEFHHINPEEKSYGLSAKGNTHNLLLDLKEVQKCILVCANCHREIHDGMYTAEELLNLQVYDESFANELIKNNSKQEIQCKQCGKIISKNENTLCRECYQKSTRIAERPNREELKSLIRTKSFVDIGKMYQVSDNSIRKWCIAENLPSKKKDILNYTDAQWRLI